MKNLVTTSGTVFTGTLVLGTSAYCVWQWYLKRFACITLIHAERQMISQNLLKSYFETHLQDIEDQLGPTFKNRYMRIFSERRILEDLIYEIFAQLGLRFRDVGGSQIRPRAHNHLKHLCEPPTQGSNGVYTKREGIRKERQTFLSCNSFSHCPYKEAFPGLLLSYSDYYMDQDELASLVKFHSFIVTQRFDSKAGSFHGEQNWRKVGDRIELVLPDGQMHSHYWNEWQSDGIVVGKNGAFKYVLVYSGPTSNVYYAYPHPGTYNGADPKCLRRSTELKQVRLISGYRACLYADRVQIFDSHQNLVFEHDRNFFDEVVSQFGRKQRDDDFFLAVKSFLDTRSRESWICIDNAPFVLELTLILCNRFAFNIVGNTFDAYDPYKVTLLTKLRFCLWNFAKRRKNKCPNFVAMPRYFKTNCNFLERNVNRKDIKKVSKDLDRWTLESLNVDNADFSPLIVTDHVKGEKFVYSPMFVFDPFHVETEDAQYISIDDLNKFEINSIICKKKGKEVLRNYLERFLEYFIKQNKKNCDRNDSKCIIH